MSAALSCALGGKGSTVLVYGEAGIGKTTLLRAAFGGAVAPSRQRVGWGGCEALFSPRPLGPLHDMADLFGERTRAALRREGARSEFFTRALAELREAPQANVLVIEDVHWADEATLDFVKFLSRRIDAAPVLLVLSYRDDELSERHPLRHVLGDLPHASTTRIALPPLSQAGVARLAQRSQPGAHDAAALRRLHEATRGNPFFVVECLRSEGVPATVRDAVLARAARQSPAVRSLLDLVAIVPSRAENSLVQAVLTPAAEDLSSALACGLLIVDGPHLAFRHELARVAVAEALPLPAAASLHARVFAHLEGQPEGAVPLARLMHHAAAAGLQDKVLRLAPIAAAQAAAQGAHREAAALLAAALQRATALTGTEHALLLEHHAYECYLTDQIDAAIASREAALTIWRATNDRDREGHTLRWLSRLHWFTGHTDRAVDLAEQAITLLQSLPPGLELAWAMSNRSQLHMLKEELSGAVDWGRRAIALAERLGAEEVRAHALNNVGTAQRMAGVPEGQHTQTESLSLALKLDLAEHVARAYSNLVSSSVTQRDYETARRYAAEAQAYFAARDLDSWANYVTMWMCRTEMEQGDWNLAEDMALQVLGRPGVAAISRGPALTTLARLRLRRGDPAGWQALAEATAIARGIGEMQRLTPVAAAHAEAAWLRVPAEGGGDAEPPDLALALDTYDKALRGRNPRASGELGFWLRLLGIPHSATGADMTLEPAQAHAVAGRWREAAAAWQALGCRYERALVLHAGGDAAAMHEALAEAEALGAAAAAERMRATMRKHGIKGMARGPRATTAEHPAGLTLREAQVLALLAQGLTNAEIAARLVRSAKTVDHHVAAILGKLQARSRAEASAMAAKLGLLNDTAGGGQRR